MKKAICLILSVAMTGCLLAGCGNGATGSQASSGQASAASGNTVNRQPMSVSIGCGTSTGVGYITASTVGSLLSSKYPTYQCKPEVTTGGAENIRLLLNGDIQLCSAMLDVATNAYKGTREWDAKSKGKLRYITSGNMTTLTQFARKESGAKELPDLKGKNIGVASGTTAQFYWKYLLEAYGLTDKDFKSVKVLGIKDILTAMQDGSIDYGVHTTSVPNSSIQDTAMTVGLNVLTMSDDICEKLIKANPGFEKTKITKETYTSDFDAQTVGVRNVYVCLSDSDDQLVYDWTKTIDENQKALVQAHPGAGQYGKHENVLNCQKFPFHPAAERYYKEVGLLK